MKTSVVSAGELADLQPRTNVDDVGAAAYEPDSGYANPVETVEGFRRRAEILGARIMQWTAVTRIDRRESRVCGVETSAGRIDAGAVVLAAGAWSGAWARHRHRSAHAPEAIDTVAVRGPNHRHMVFIDNVLGSYFRPEAEETLVGVPCQEWDIDPDTLGRDSAEAAGGEPAATHRIPAMERATLAWLSIRRL